MPRKSRNRVRFANRNKYGLSVMPTLRGAYKYFVAPTARGARIAATVPLKLAYNLVGKPIYRGTQVTSDFVEKHPQATNALVAAGLLGLAGVGFYKGLYASGAEGMAGLSNLKTDLTNLTTTTLVPLANVTADVTSAVKNRDVIAAAKGLGNFAVTSVKNLPSIVYDSGHALYDASYSAGAMGSAGANIANPGSWLRTLGPMQHWNPITERWTADRRTWAEYEKRRKLGLLSMAQDWFSY